MSFTLRPFASAALLLSMAGLCAGTLLAAEQTEPSEASAVRARPLVLGVVETAEPSFDDNTVRPVLKAMQSAAPGTQIDVVRLSSATFEVAVAQLKPDLVISPAADFLRIVDSIGAHPIGTRKTKYAKHPSKSAGGAVITLASRTDIQKLTDLRGKQIAATLPTSVDGMLAVRMELAERGFDSRQFFGSVRYLGYSMPNVIESVLSGHFDAGVVPVCTLERIEAEDLIERGALRVISPKSDDDTVCAHTSELYPDLVAATFSWTDPELTQLTTSTLLASKSADAEFNWYGTSDFHRIRALEETLQIGPWAYLQEMTPEALWRRWRFAVFAVLAGLGLLLLNEWRLRRLVAKRTGELKRSMEERDRLAQRERAVRDRLSSLERMGWDVAVWHSGGAFLDEADLMRPGCLVLDVRMPGLTGLDVQAELERRGSNLPILFLSAHGSIQMAVHVMRHGAVDFLEKPVEPMTLVQRVAQCVTASLSAKADDAAADEVRRRFDRLTPREREVIDGVLKNAPNKIIARTLGIELSTVKMHRANAFAKLGVHSPGELLKMAYEAGIVSSAASAAESSDAQAF